MKIERKEVNKQEFFQKITSKKGRKIKKKLSKQITHMKA